MVDTPHIKPTVGVVLVGGQSRRMGVDKARLRWRTDTGETITWSEHTRRRLQAVCNHVLISGAEEGVPDRGGTHRGPLAGIATVLELYPERRCMFMPVDMPWVTSEALLTLRDIATPHGYFADSQFPLVLTADPDTRQRLGQLLTHPDPKQHSLRNLFRHLPDPSVTVLTATQRSRMRNVNRPGDLGPELYSLNLPLLEHSLS